MYLYEVLDALNNSFIEVNNRKTLRNMYNMIQIPYEEQFWITDYAFVTVPYENKAYTLAGMMNHSIDYNEEIRSISWLHEHGGVMLCKLHVDNKYVGNILLAHNLFQSTMMFFDYFCSVDVLFDFFKKLNNIKKDIDIEPEAIFNDISMKIFTDISQKYVIYEWFKLKEITEILYNNYLVYKEQQYQNQQQINNMQMLQGTQIDYSKMKNSSINSGQIIGTGMAVAGTGMTVAGTGARVVGKTAQVGGTVVNGVGKVGNVIGTGIASAGGALSVTGVGAVVGVPLSIVGGAVKLGSYGVQGVGTATKVAGKGVDAVGKGVKETGKEVHENSKEVKEEAKVEAIKEEVKVDSYKKNNKYNNINNSNVKYI